MFGRVWLSGEKEFEGVKGEKMFGVKRFGAAKRDFEVLILLINKKPPCCFVLLFHPRYQRHPRFRNLDKSLAGGNMATDW